MSTATAITQQINELLKQHASEISTLKTKIRRLTRQKDEAVGKAREYRGYATKYQRELVALRKEMK